MIVELTQPLTRMSINNLSGGEAHSERKAGKLIDICEVIVQTMWDPRRLTNL
jgi:hypothetical protein